MSDFIKDTVTIDEKLNIQMPDVPSEPLEAVMLPFYVDPNSMEVMVVVKRCLLPGSYKRTGKRMGITALTITLPEDEHITIDQAYESLNLQSKMQEAIPFGTIMPDPYNSHKTYEMIIVHVEPLPLLDKKRGIYYQEKGKYEIGVVSFGDVMDGINGQLILDMKTRLILNELYIMMAEQAGQQNQQNPTPAAPGRIGGGNNLPQGFGEQEGTVKTSTIPDDVIAQNSQTDFGAIYSRVSVSGNEEFKPISKE